ncbi:MAG: hypothetical protein VX288_06670 [Planctomycetota bacterium]|nr:hypothetical protein [Planctomycetota bacterium]
MDERFPWQQIIILLLIFGGSILKFIFQGRGQEENQPGQAGRPPGAKSPALEILEKIREQNESVAARQVQAPASTLEREVEQEEDAYYGDDDLEGVSGLQSTEVPTISEKPQPAAAGVVIAPGDQQQAPKKRRSGDRIPGTIRTPRAEVLQPHSTDLQTGVSAPRTSDEKVHSQDLEIEDDLAIHTSTSSGVRRGTRSLHLPESLGGGQLSLRQAIIGQVILGPPKALEKQAGKQADPIRIP